MGTSELDESLLSGESAPVVRSVGAQVTGGTINLTGALDVEVTALGTQSVLGQLARRVEEAQASRAPTQRLVDPAGRQLQRPLSQVDHGHPGQVRLGLRLV